MFPCLFWLGILMCLCCFLTIYSNQYHREIFLTNWRNEAEPKLCSPAGSASVNVWLCLQEAYWYWWCHIAILVRMKGKKVDAKWIVNNWKTILKNRTLCLDSTTIPVSFSVRTMENHFIFNLKQRSYKWFWCLWNKCLLPIFNGIPDLSGKYKLHHPTKSLDWILFHTVICASHQIVKMISF